jgi:hypothetical protein
MHFSPRLARIVRRLLLGIAILATLLLITVLVVNWCGARAWERAMAGELAAGRDLSKLPPPGDLAPERNLMCAPIVQQLLYKERNCESFPPSNTYMAIGANETDTWREGHRMNMAAAYQAVRKYDASQPEGVDPEQGLMDTFREDRALVAKLRQEALQRGDAQLVRPSPPEPTNYLSTAILSFKADRRLTMMLRLEACLALRQGRAQDGLENTLTLLRLARGHGGSGQVFVVESMMQSVMLREALWPVWEASRQHLWSASQWALIDRELERLNLPDTFVKALRLEAQNVTKLIDRTGLSEPGLFSEEPNGWLKLAFNLAFVQGLRDQNKAISVEYARQWIALLEAAGTARYPGLRAQANQAQQTLLDGWPGNPNKFIFRVAMPDYHKAVDSLMTWQSYLSMARVASALEVYRLREGRYPESLEGLGESVFRALPRDPVNGSVLHYRLRSDGDYELYAVGVDAKDDGGGEHSSIWPKPYSPGDVIWCRLKDAPVK